MKANHRKESMVAKTKINRMSVLGRQQRGCLNCVKNESRIPTSLIWYLPTWRLQPWNLSQGSSLYWWRQCWPSISTIHFRVPTSSFPDTSCSFCYDDLHAKTCI